MNNLIQVLQEEYYAFHNKEMDATEALKLFKSLPSRYDNSIISNDVETFQFLIKQDVAYLGFNKGEIKEIQFKVLSEVVAKKMDENHLTYRSLGRLVGLSERTVYDFVVNNHPLNAKHLQDILFQFGLALAPVSNAEFAEKYLQVVRDPFDEGMESEPSEPEETPPVIEEPEEVVPETPVGDTEPEEPIQDSTPDIPVEDNKPLEPVEDATPEQPTETEPVTEGGDEVVAETEEVIEPVETP